MDCPVSAERGEEVGDWSRRSRVSEILFRCPMAPGPGGSLGMNPASRRNTAPVSGLRPAGGTLRDVQEVGQAALRERQI